MRRLAQLASLALCVLGCVYTASAQNTVTGTIHDPQGNPYANGTASAFLAVVSGQTQPPSTNVTTNGAGFFTMTLVTGSYSFTICAPPSQLPPVNPVANPTPRQVCFQSAPISISSNPQDVSATLNAIAPSLGPQGSQNGGSQTLSSLNNIIFVDGVTNKTVATGVTAALANSQSLHIPTGTWPICAVINLAGANGLDIGGDGIGRTILQQSASCNLNYIFGSSGSTNITNLSIHDLTIDVNGPAQTGGFGRCFDFESSGVHTNMKFLRVECKNTTDATNGHGLFGTGGGSNTKLEIANSLFNNIASHGVFVDSTVNSSFLNIHDNYIESKAQAVELDGVNGCGVQNNRFKQLATSNLVGLAIGSQNCVISDNTALGLGVTSGLGSDLFTADATSGATQYIHFVGNVAYNSGDNCFSVLKANYVDVIGNQCHDAGSHGIVIAGGIGATVRSNFVFNPGQATGLANIEKVGIKILSATGVATTNATVVANHIYDNLAGHIMLYGVAIDNTPNGGISGSVIASNDIYNAQTQNVAVVGSNTSGVTTGMQSNSDPNGAWLEGNLRNGTYTHRIASGLSAAQITDLMFNDSGGGGNDVWSWRKDVDNSINLLDVANSRKIIAAAAGGVPLFNFGLRSKYISANLGTVCTNGELALSAGWQSTGFATVTAVAGTGQTCSWTITTGTTTAANPTVTDTLTNVLPDNTTVCEMNIHGGTHTAAAGEGFQQTTISGSVPVFTFNGTPTAGGTTYLVTRRCGP